MGPNVSRDNFFFYLVKFKILEFSAPLTLVRWNDNGGNTTEKQHCVLGKPLFPIFRPTSQLQPNKSMRTELFYFECYDDQWRRSKFFRPIWLKIARFLPMIFVFSSLPECPKNFQIALSEILV